MGDMQAVFIDFENIAIWASHEYFELDLTRLFEYLRSRGPVVMKRAYADWSRFPAYRDDMLNNSIDLIQMYSVSSFKNKNRADIRLALDAFEVAMTRPQIKTFVIVSGDSDFGALIGRLREHGLYTIGIGPRSATHPLLVTACDEYVYLETILGEPLHENGQATNDRESARQLLKRALDVFGKRGELPAPAAKLKTTMTSIDPAFNEANLGYGQFREWLESNSDLAKLYFKDIVMYVAPADFAGPNLGDLKRVAAPEPVRAAVGSTAQSQTAQYVQALNRTVGLIDLPTRRDVLRDIYHELSEQPGRRDANTLLDELAERYAARGLVRPRQLLLKVWQMGFRGRAYDYQGQPVAFSTAVQLAKGVTDVTTFIRWAEASYIQVLVNAGLPIERSELATALLDDAQQVDYIDSLLDDLVQRGLIVQAGNQYRLPGKGAIPFRDAPDLQPIIREIEQLQIPDDTVRGPAAARTLAAQAMAQRSQDFAGASQTYLLACRVQWDAVNSSVPGATLEDLRWYIASYVSTRAGALSQVQHNFQAARPYYLAFFWLVQEDDPLWDRMRGLINPMLSYYWVNAARELNLSFSPSNSPAKTAVQTATHPNPELKPTVARSDRISG